RSDAMDADRIGVRGERSKVYNIAAKHGSCRLRHRDHDGVNGGPLARSCPQGGSTTGKVLRKLFDDVAGLEQPVDECVSSLATGERFDEHDRRDDRWPQTVTLEDRDERGDVLATLSETADRAGI